MIAENKALQPQAVGKPGRKTKAAVAGALVLLIVAGAVLGRSLYLGYQHSREVSAAIDTDAFYSGIVVQGVELGGKSMSEAQAAVEAALSGAQSPVELRIAGAGKTWRITNKNLKFQYNTNDVLKEAYAWARSGDREERYRQVQSLKTSPKTYTVTGKVEESSLESALNAVADEVDTAAQNPRVTAFNTETKQFSFANGKNGVSVDREKLLAGAKSVLESGGVGTVSLSTGEVPFKGTLDDLKAHMKLLGTFSTVSKNNANGTYNMTRALLSANGVCVEPGATFSFFGTAGECGQAQGYKQAGAILNGKLVQEYGGGICQASTTVYGAAVRAGMKITERYNHSIPSSYCPIGQDATVSYPGLDFKFTNPADYPVYLVTSVKNRVLTAAVYGYHPDGYDSVDVVSQVTDTISAPTQAQYILDPSLNKGVIKMTSKARAGYKVKAQRIFRRNGTSVKTEDLPSSYYRPQPAYYAYGKGTDLTRESAARGASAQPAESSKPASSPPPAAKVSSAPPASSAPAASSPVSEDSAAGAAANDDVTAQGEPAA
ncbi:VanW family protein [Caproicibacter fermentans]|uniref:VanW family protein n=1 Tax=Caproicibacter fermentans TaxID=2576756 RepID=A0A7G8T747_9FIRM|nr:VanW family protein [Caproicibacter fermentans]QNK39438.1 VanW family protein [Caproicibacter fermentans]